MILNAEQIEKVKGSGAGYILEACDRCGILMHGWNFRFTARGQEDAWCSRECRDGAAAKNPGICQQCGSPLPADKRRGALFCDATCRQAAHRGENPRQQMAAAA